VKDARTSRAQERCGQFFAFLGIAREHPAQVARSSAERGFRGGQAGHVDVEDFRGRVPITAMQSGCASAKPTRSPASA
jgi:hypothetical protein